jgi:anti-sigma regulatory factor (Ser/Thr protein kinase)
VVFNALYPSALESVRAARHALVAFARTVGFAGETLADLEIAIGEALANAGEHGHAPGGSIEVGASFEGDTLKIEVKDGGPGFDGWKSAADTPRAVSSPRGFGLHIMRAVADRIEYRDGGRRVIITKRCAVDAVIPDDCEA